MKLVHSLNLRPIVVGGVPNYDVILRPVLPNTEYVLIPHVVANRVTSGWLLQNGHIAIPVIYTVGYP